MKTVAALEYLKLRTAVALKAWNQVATAAGLVLWTPVLRVPVMEEIPVVGDSSSGSGGAIDVLGGVSAGSSSVGGVH